MIIVKFTVGFLWYIMYYILKISKNSKMANYKEKNLQYSVILDPAVEGGYNASFPAFPGCVTYGRTYEEAKEKAREVLELWLEELTEDGFKIPVFRSCPVVDEIEVAMPVNSKIYVTNNS